MIGEILSNNVEVFYVIGDKATGKSAKGSFKMDKGTVHRYMIDDEESSVAKFNMAAKISSGIFTDWGMYGFYISDDVCEKLGIPSDGTTIEEFYAGFNERFANYA